MIRSLRRRSPDAIHLAAVILLCKIVRAEIVKGVLTGRAVSPNPTAPWSAGWRTFDGQRYLSFIPPVKMVEPRIEREIIAHIVTSFGVSKDGLETRDSGGNLAIRCWIPVTEPQEAE